MRIGELEGRRVALWGWGSEGRAAYRAVRARLPDQALTVIGNDAEAAQIAALGDPLLRASTCADAQALAAFDAIVKSPGISPYREEVEYAVARGTRFTSGTALWFGERAHDGTLARAVCVTGTKGKSTTSALLAHVLRAAGQRTALAGNIGLPLLDLLDGQADAWVIELSSYQTRDVAAVGARPQLAIVTNIHPEHLDWHGSQQRYVEDKLALVTQGKPRVAVLNAADATLAALCLPKSEIHWYGEARGWHLRGDGLYRGDDFVWDTSAFKLPGRHNRGNLCAVLTALDALGFDAAALAGHASSFQPLPHRLQVLGEHDGITFVDDSISTTPMATLAALDLYAGREVAVLVGGHDRGLPWEEFADAMGTRAPRAVVTMGQGVPAQNGPRIHDLLEPLARGGRFELCAATDLADAVRQARKALPDGGVILLSPGAPSFGPYANYIARGGHFAQLAGFDPETPGSIPGMGIV